MNAPLLAFYGDDFTGSTDALESLTRAGARTVLFVAPPTRGQLARFAPLDAVGVAGTTRSLSADAIARELRPAFATLRTLGPRHVHYKVCSTFDSSPGIGSIGCAIDVGAEVFGARFVPLLVSAPHLGRYTVFGHHFARFGTEGDGEVFRLDRHPSMSRHPVTPADESDLRLHLGRQTRRRVALVDILTLERPLAEIRARLDRLVADDVPVVLFDALHPAQMQRIGALLDDCAAVHEPLFSVGSSGIEAALGAHWNATGRLQPAKRWAQVAASSPLIVASGSCSPVTKRQIAHAVAAGFVEIPLVGWPRISSSTAERAKVNLHDPDTTPEHAEINARRREAIASAVAHLREGRSVIVHTGEVRDMALPAATVGTGLGSIVRSLVSQTGVRRIVIAGGDTSSHAVRALGIEALEMLAPLAPGAPLCRAHAPNSPLDACTVVFKGGQVGGDDCFVRAAGGQP